MDTGTHFVFGISLAGLATISPTINTDPSLTQAILISTIIGSQAPDFDGVTRFLGGTANYIKNHRGLTHSLPAIIIWPIVITLLLLLFYPSDYFSLLFLWIFLAVLLHVSLDVLNSYGTQVLRPFSEKWIALDIINIFDPFIFILHTIGIILWTTQIIEPKYIFIPVYLITAFYIVWRILIHHKTKNLIINKYKFTGKITILPTIKWSVFNVIEEKEQLYNIGTIFKEKVELVDIKYKTVEDEPQKRAKLDKRIKSFLYFSNFAFPETEKTYYGYKVQWIDLRYRFNNHYPFLGIVLLADDFKIIDSYVGWVYNEKHFKRKEISLLKQN